MLTHISPRHIARPQRQPWCLAQRATRAAPDVRPWHVQRSEKAPKLGGRSAWRGSCRRKALAECRDPAEPVSIRAARASVPAVQGSPGAGSCWRGFGAIPPIQMPAVALRTGDALCRLGAGPQTRHRPAQPAALTIHRRLPAGGCGSIIVLVPGVVQASGRRGIGRARADKRTACSDCVRRLPRPALVSGRESPWPKL